MRLCRASVLNFVPVLRMVKQTVFWCTYANYLLFDEVIILWHELFDCC